MPDEVCERRTAPLTKRTTIKDNVRTIPVRGYAARFVLREVPGVRPEGDDHRRITVQARVPVSLLFLSCVGGGGWRGGEGAVPIGPLVSKDFSLCYCHAAPPVGFSHEFFWGVGIYRTPQNSIQCHMLHGTARGPLNHQSSWGKVRQFLSCRSPPNKFSGTGSDTAREKG